jgi:hypothetical protein
MSGDVMTDVKTVSPSRMLRRFSSHAEQEVETRRYWKGRPAKERFQVVEEMAEQYCRMRGIDIDAQGPKGLTVRVQRGRG